MPGAHRSRRTLSTQVPLAGALCVLALAGCGGGGGGGGGVGGGDGGGGGPAGTREYAVGGTITNYLGSGLKLALAVGGTQAQTIDASGTSFEFDPVADRSTYAVTVAQQPVDPVQNCAVTGGAGTVAGADVHSLAVSCSPPAFHVHVAVTGLSGKGLVLQNKGADDLAVAHDGTFTFATPVTSDEGYTVTVATQPTSPWQTCAVAKDTGSPTADVTLDVTCTTLHYALSASIQDYAGSGLELSYGGTSYKVTAGSTSIQLANDVASGTQYQVGVAQQPSTSIPAQTCSVPTPSGTVGGENVVVPVKCSTNTYNVQVTVTGLVSGSTGLMLEESIGGDYLYPTSSGDWTFPTKVASGADYSVKLKANPTAPPQSCTVQHGSSKMGTADATVALQCFRVFKISGNFEGWFPVSLLKWGRIVLSSSHGDSGVTMQNGSFSFPLLVPAGTTFEITPDLQYMSGNSTTAIRCWSKITGKVVDNDVDIGAIECRDDQLIIAPITHNTYPGRIGSSGDGRIDGNNQCWAELRYHTPQLSCPNSAALLTVNSADTMANLPDTMANLPPNYVSIPRYTAITRPDGTVIANSWSELMSGLQHGSLQNDLAPEIVIWWSGDVRGGGVNCTSWSTSNSSVSGIVGSSTHAYMTTYSCDTQLSLMCVCW